METVTTYEIPSDVIVLLVCAVWSLLAMLIAAWAERHGGRRKDGKP
ncbi:MAG: hypothetical protein GX591_11985 [Planctomycetes bacterium]|nr:hypothetical protein [Planctomycetota bacterium]